MDVLCRRACSPFATISIVSLSPLPLPPTHKGHWYHHCSFADLACVRAARYTTFDSNVDKKMILNAIGATASVALKKRALDWATSGAILLQDFFYVIYSVGGSSAEGTAIAWQYFQDNFDRLRAMVATASPSLFGAVIGGSTSGFVTREAAESVQAFFEANPVPQNQRLISQLLESIRGNAGFAERLLGSKMVEESYWKTL